MRMESEPVHGTTAELITTEQLQASVKKSVMFIGKVVSSTNSMLELDGGSGGPQVRVQRAQPALTHVDESSTVLVRGYVNDDLSISEAAGYAPTVLSDNFGKCHTRTPPARILTSPQTCSCRTTPCRSRRTPRTKACSPTSPAVARPVSLFHVHFSHLRVLLPQARHLLLELVDLLLLPNKHLLDFTRLPRERQHQLRVEV